MSRETRYQRRLKQKKRHKIVISIILLLLCAIVISVLVSSLSTNVYKDKDEFKEYADNELDLINTFDVEEVRKVNYEYSTPISYAVDYDVCDNKFIESFRDEKIQAIKSQFAEITKKEEKSRAEQHKNEKRYKPLEHALIIKSTVYTSYNGVITLAIYESENTEKDKDMAKTASNIHTYQFSEKTGNNLVAQQIFSENYKETCAEYFKKYFEKEYKKDELADGWEKYLEPTEANFNKYILTDTGATFCFDEGTILKKSEGLVYAGISAAEMGTALRKYVKERYIDPEKPMVAITYDDGPGGKSEERILKCLKQNGGVATFFYLGNRVKTAPENIKTAYEMGCEIGNHTWDHPVLTTLNKAQLAKQFKKTNEAIKDVCGAYPTVFRPSYGETNKTINKKSELPVIMWSVDTLDWQSRNAKKVFKVVKKTPDLDGKIILMHSIYDSTADATELIVPWLKDKGYQMVTVSELIKYRQGKDPQKGKVY